MIRSELKCKRQCTPLNNTLENHIILELSGIEARNQTLIQYETKVNYLVTKVK